MSVTIDCGEGRHAVCSGSGSDAYLIPQLSGERFTCGCRCHRPTVHRAVGRMGLSGNVHVDDRADRPTDEAIAEQQRMTEAYYADPDV